MYKYYKELEYPNNFKICLRKHKDYYEGIYIKDAPLNDNFYNKYQKLFLELNFIDKLVNAFNSSWVEAKDYEEWKRNGEFLSLLINHNKYQYEDYEASLELFKENTLEYDLYYYKNVCKYLVDIYPSYKERIETIYEYIKEAIKDVNHTKYISIKEDDYINYNFANAFFITPKGNLYNSGGKFGHKNGNFKYLYYKILQALENNTEIEKGYISNSDEIKATETRGYVTQCQFQNYFNLIHKIITIETPEVIESKEKSSIIFEKYKDTLDLVNINNYCKNDIILGLLNYERTYQKNILKLIIGYLKAEEEFYNGWLKLNDSKDKKHLYNKIKDYDLVELMVRFLGFHKVESSLSKTITTSNLNIELFNKYIDNDFTIHLIPALVYDKYQDDIMPLDFNSYYIRNKLEEIENKYKGKVKINRNKIYR